MSCLDNFQREAAHLRILGKTDMPSFLFSFNLGDLDRFPFCFYDVARNLKMDIQTRVKTRQRG